jgi:hypothetical protein
MDEMKSSLYAIPPLADKNDCCSLSKLQSELVASKQHHDSASLPRSGNPFTKFYFSGRDLSTATRP